MSVTESILVRAGLPAAVAAAVAPAFVGRQLKRGDYFVATGEVAPRMALVQSGQFIFGVDNDGDEICTYHAGPGSVIVSMASFFRERPSREFIKAIADADILVLESHDYRRLKNQYPAFMAWSLAMLEHEIVCINERKLDLIVLSAEERYQMLLQSEPQLLQELPLKYLASILGVTPRHLSRIRSQVR